MAHPAFKDRPEEAAIIGRLLAFYGELEFLLALSVGRSIGLGIANVRKGVRDFFTIRNADDRIDYAKQEARLPMRLTGLKGQFAEALTSIRNARKSGTASPIAIGFR